MVKLKKEKLNYIPGHVESTVVDCSLGGEIIDIICEGWGGNYPGIFAIIEDDPDLPKSYEWTLYVQGLGTEVILPYSEVWTVQTGPNNTLAVYLR